MIMDYKTYKKGDVIKTWQVENGKVLVTIEINGVWVSNPTIQMLEADGWQEYTEPTPVRTLEEAINDKVTAISNYDSSVAVNEFFLNGVGMWYDFMGREKIRSRINRDKAKGKSTTILGDDGYVVELPIATAETMMEQIEDYATECYDVTNAHKVAVRSKQSVAEVDSYDYTTGYPSKLNFSLNGYES